MARRKTLFYDLVCDISTNLRRLRAHLPQPPSHRGLQLSKAIIHSSLPVLRGRNPLPCLHFISQTWSHTQSPLTSASSSSPTSGSTSRNAPDISLSVDAGMTSHRVGGLWTHRQRSVGRCAPCDALNAWRAACSSAHPVRRPTRNQQSEMLTLNHIPQLRDHALHDALRRVAVLPPPPKLEQQPIVCDLVRREARVQVIQRRELRLKAVQVR